MTERFSVEACLPDEIGLFCAWCETCLEPVAGVEYEMRPLPVRPERAFVGPRLTALPCGHGPNPDRGDQVLTAGLVSIVGEGVGPLPSVSIVGFDPGRFASVPVPVG